MREGKVRKKPFHKKRSLRKRDSWKVTCDVDVVFVHARKPRGRIEKNPCTLREKTEKTFCRMMASVKTIEADFRLTFLSTF